MEIEAGSLYATIAIGIGEKEKNVIAGDVMNQGEVHPDVKFSL